ncbi:MAG: hypothetical protein KIT09_27205 [Bryobacteraceae bacterium]|nr:hypothetical protein [Bryobacteraceae bacterium]
MEQRLLPTLLSLLLLLTIVFVFALPNAVASDSLSGAPLLALGDNLIVNGDGEGGAGSTDCSGPVPVPGWTTTGNVRVCRYGAGFDYPRPDDPGPAARGQNFFAGGPFDEKSSATQVINAASLAGDIDRGVWYHLSAWLGGFADQNDSAVVRVTFKNAQGVGLSSVALGPVLDTDRNDQTSLLYRERAGSVPAGARSIEVVMEMTRDEGNSNDGYLDNLSLVLGGAPPTGVNLLLNGDAEAGQGDAACENVLAVPNWTLTGRVRVCNYGAGEDYPRANDPGPASRGRNFFAGGPDDVKSTATQVIDLGAFASAIDSGLGYALSGWLGGFDGQEDNAALKLVFKDRAGITLGSVSIGPVTSSDREGATGFVYREVKGTAPRNARTAEAVLEMTRTEGVSNDGYADNLSFTLGESGEGSLTIVNGASYVAPIAAGSWAAIFGASLAAATVSAPSIPLPNQLGDVTVSMNGKPSPLLFVSPAQINAQVPWDVLPSGSTAGPAAVSVMRGGSVVAQGTVQVAPASPGIFALQAGDKLLAVSVNADGSLTQAAGAVPGMACRAARAGDTIILYANALGAVSPAAQSGNNSMDALRMTTSVPQVLIGGRAATVAFSGLSPQFVGVNQLNVVVPAGVAASSYAPVQIVAGGITSSDRVTIALTN